MTGAESDGSAVLVRAVEPLTGIDLLQQLRPDRAGPNITNGPAKLCQALRIDKQLNGHNLSLQPLTLQLGLALPTTSITTTTRIGINKATTKRWRYYITGNLYVSRL